MSIYVNRILNMKHIKAIGLDMDHTLVRYHSDKFEELTFRETIRKLISNCEYPKEIQDFEFDFQRAIRGLIVDKERGNVLKVNLHNKIKTAYHGTQVIHHKEQKRLYRGLSTDLRDNNFLSIDTTFSIAFTIIFTQLVDLKDAMPDLHLPSYAEMAEDVIYAVDLAHMDGSLKDVVKNNLSEYIIKDEKTVLALERLKKYGKKVWIITNSDYNYSKALLDYTITPFLKENKNWEELFEFVITLARKPDFFISNTSFLKIDAKSGLMSNHFKKLEPGIYQGGNAISLQENSGLAGDEILYLGDHIYGDILKLKKSCEWRTALVIEEIDREVLAYKNTKDISIEIDQLMEQKIELEGELDELYTKEFEGGEEIPKQDINAKFKEMEKIDKALAVKIKSYESHFNPYWGEVMRSGAEPSFFAAQIERYACIIMDKVSDLYDNSPRKYFRPKKRKMSHEL